VLGLGLCGICGFKDYERVIVNCKVGFEERNTYCYFMYYIVLIHIHNYCLLHPWWCNKSAVSLTSRFTFNTAFQAFMQCIITDTCVQ